MIRSAKAHVRSYGYGLRPYNDSSLQTVGVICEVMHELFHMDAVKVGDQTERTPLIRKMAFSHEGRAALARFLSTGERKAQWTDALDELERELDS